jgi:hypothetical protein
MLSKRVTEMAGCRDDDWAGGVAELCFSTTYSIDGAVELVLAFTQCQGYLLSFFQCERDDGQLELICAEASWSCLRLHTGAPGPLTRVLKASWM